MPDILDEIKSLNEANEVPKEPVVAPVIPTPEPTPAPVATPTAEPAAVAPIAEPTIPAADVVIPPVQPDVVIPSAAANQLEVLKEPEFDRAKYLDELSGGTVKSEDDLKKLLSEYKQAQQVMQDPNYEYAQKLSAWEKEGRPKELFHAVQSLKADELSVEDKVKLKLKLENPTFTKEDIDLFIKEEYKQDTEVHSEQSIKVGLLRMQRDATAFTPELKKMQSMTVVNSDPAQRQREFEQKETVRRDAWKQELPKLVDGFKSITVPLNNKENYEWKVTKEQSADLLKSLENIVQNAPVQLNEQGINAIKDIMQKEFYSKNINQIASGISTYIASKKTDEHIKAIHNPTGAVQPAAAAVESKVSGSEAALKGIMEMEGITGRR